MSENLTGFRDTLFAGLWIGIALIFLLVVSKEAISWYFNLGWPFETSVPLVPMAWVGNIAVNLYIRYHRISLPTWLTFGYAVEFGGAMSNVCTDTDMSSDYEGDGGWPCFPSKLHGWLADVAGPEGWKYLLQPPAKLVLCLLFLAFNVGMLAVLVAVVRDPECLYESPRHREERKQRKKCERCAETGLRELDEIKND